MNNSAEFSQRSHGFCVNLYFNFRLKEMVVWLYGCMVRSSMTDIAGKERLIIKIFG